MLYSSFSKFGLWLLEVYRNGTSIRPGMYKVVGGRTSCMQVYYTTKTSCIFLREVCKLLNIRITLGINGI